MGSIDFHSKIDLVSSSKGVAVNSVALSSTTLSTAATTNVIMTSNQGTDTDTTDHLMLEGSHLQTLRNRFTPEKNDKRI